MLHGSTGFQGGIAAEAARGPGERRRCDLALCAGRRIDSAAMSEPASTTSHGSAPGIRIEHQGDVLVMTINHPARNEITGAMFEAMLEALGREAVQPRARVLRIRAEGEVFCLGRERAGRDEAAVRAEVTRLIALKRAVMTSPLISVAEVQGDAAGFGVGLAVVCDFTVVADTAKLSFPEMRHGLPPAAIMAYIGRYALPKRVFPLILLAPEFTAAHACDIGLVTQTARPGALRGDVDELVHRVLAMDADAVRQCKVYFQAAQDGAIDDNFSRATELLTARTLRLLAQRG
jgi:enoyl-CoA hydratase/carnithine racemase